MSKEKIEDFKIEKVMEILESIKSENMDIYDVSAVLISDINDMMKAKDSKQFLKQKRDLRKTLKFLKRMITNKKFKK